MSNGRAGRAAPLLGLAVALGATFWAAPTPAAEPLSSRPLTLEVTPLSMTGPWADAAAAKGARLEPIAGFLLDSPDRAFGGLSGLVLTPGGARFVSDLGSWGELALTRDASGRITGVEGRVIGRIADRDGLPLSRWGRDAESMAMAANGALWIGFERLDRVVAYNAPDAPPVAEAAQLPVGGIDYNKGIEALAATPDGALIAIAEDPPRGSEHLAGWRLVNGEAQPFSIETDRAFSATGADVGPDGALYLLERRFGLLSGVRMRIRRFPDIQRRLSAGSEGRVLALGAGEILIELDGSAPIDNMEGLAVEQGGDGRLLLTLVSDDNFFALQHTVLLQFALKR